MKKRLTYFSPCSGTIPYAAMNTLMNGSKLNVEQNIGDPEFEGDPQ